MVEIKCLPMPKFFVTLEDHSISARLKLATLWIVAYLLCRLPASDEAFLDHDEPGGPVRGPGPAILMMEAMYKRFPDLQAWIEDIRAERDKVVVRNVWTGTAPDSQLIRFKGFVMWRLLNGKIVERWATFGPILQDPTAAEGWI